MYKRLAIGHCTNHNYVVTWARATRARGHNFTLSRADGVFRSDHATLFTKGKLKRAQTEESKILKWVILFLFFFFNSSDMWSTIQAQEYNRDTVFFNIDSERWLWITFRLFNIVISAGWIDVIMDCHVVSEEVADSKSSEWLQKDNFPSGTLKNGDSPPGAPEQLKGKCNENKRKSSHIHLGRYRDRNLHCLKRKGTGSFAKLDRFNRTVLALQYSGLFEISTGIFQLVRDSELLQKEINKLQEETVEFKRRLTEQQQFNREEQSWPPCPKNEEPARVVLEAERMHRLCRWLWCLLHDNFILIKYQRSVVLNLKPDFAG